jgi:tetraacyldisaccharide 4'-kinase
MLGSIYAAVAAARRRSYRRPGGQRRLQRPVISVGNLRVGGTGKTPAVAYLSRLLTAMGERPAILSRGYGRRVAPDGVVVVSDGERLRADLNRSGDEPLMLARAIECARVLVSADRYLSGRLAELHLGATVHVLDDGFQHLQLARGTDLLIVGSEDVADPRTLPMGRLRESLDTAAFADALLVTDATEEQAASLAARLGAAMAYRLVREAGAPRSLDVFEASVEIEAGAAGPVHGFAGVARPARFFSELRVLGWDVKGTTAFPDHHRYTAHDVAAVAAAARAEGALALVTTEKDVVRLLPFRPLPLPLLWVPLVARIEPEPAFRQWIGERIAADRALAGGGWS